jgi:hypothetical protein
MTARRASVGLLLATTLFVPGAIAQTNTTRSGELARSVRSASQRALRQIIEQHIAAARLTDSVSAYTVSPALIQLRRYLEPGRKVRLVCVIDVSLTDRQGALVATVRGTAGALGAAPDEAVSAAAEAAVARLPAALRAMRARAPQRLATE